MNPLSPWYRQLISSAGRRSLALARSNMIRCGKCCACIAVAKRNNTCNSMYLCRMPVITFLLYHDTAGDGLFSVGQTKDVDALAWAREATAIEVVPFGIYVLDSQVIDGCDDTHE